MVQSKRNLSYIGTKNLFQHNDIFADFINAVIYQGKEVLKAENIEELDSVIQTEDGKELTNDVTRKCFDGINYCIISIENQSVQKYFTVLRAMRYCVERYFKEIRANKEHHVKLHPQIVVVLYSGKGRWTYPKSL